MREGRSILYSVYSGGQFEGRISFLFKLNKLDVAQLILVRGTRETEIELLNRYMYEVIVILNRLGKPRKFTKTGVEKKVFSPPTI